VPVLILYNHYQLRIVVAKFVTQFADFLFRTGERSRGVRQICAMRVVLNPTVPISDREEI
jgi:hypothetical protein